MFRILFETCKGVEVTVGTIYRKYGQVMLALEELLHESDTFREPTREIDIVSKNKLTDTGPSMVQSMANRPSAITTSSSSSSRRTTIFSSSNNSGAVNGGGGGAVDELNSSFNTEWIETKKLTSVHQKRFEILERFSFESSDTDMPIKVEDDDLFTSQFGDDFSYVSVDCCCCCCCW